MWFFYVADLVVLMWNYNINMRYHLHFSGAFVISVLSSPAVFVLRLLHVPKFYSLLAGDCESSVHNLPWMFNFSLIQFWKIDVFLFPFVVRLTLSFVTLMSLRLLRVQVFFPFISRYIWHWMLSGVTAFCFYWYSENLVVYRKWMVQINNSMKAARRKMIEN